MPPEFQFDVFLSHSSKDKSIVRPIAERLKRDGVRVWFDEWEIKPGDSIPAKIEEGLENSRVLVLCMSAHAFGSEWALLESYTFRFREPLNRSRRLIPLRIDDAPLVGSIKQFAYIDWRLPTPEDYRALTEVCGRGETEPLLFTQVRLTSINTSIRKVGTGTRFDIAIEGINESGWTLGCSGLTINVSTIKTIDAFKSLRIHNESNSSFPTEEFLNGAEIHGFFDEKRWTDVGVAGNFDKRPAKSLLIENVFDSWGPRKLISMRSVIEGPFSRLELHLRTWANLPPEDGKSRLIGDPGWGSALGKDQQGIPAYFQSIGF